ncbi:MAG: M20/M25/M40 family metallo-hydrolase [Cytophagales bacterium]
MLKGSMDLLEKLCQLHGPSGNEKGVKDFLMDYIEKNSSSWSCKPQIYHGEDFLDCIVLVFGNPKTAAFAHMDSVGFTVRYDNKLVPIGGIEMRTGYTLVGEDSKGKIETKLVVDDDMQYVVCDYQRLIETGTELVFKCNFQETNEFVQSCYLDNRLGVWTMLKLCETIENGAIVFSCWEEHGGGTVPFLVRFLWKQYRIKQYLVADITWVSEGVKPGEGVVVSLRDERIPRRSFKERILDILKQSSISYQLEVEAFGGSDGKEIQSTPYPVEWCFIGAPEDNVHTPEEIVHKKDIEAMVEAYKLLMEKL